MSFSHVKVMLKLASEHGDDTRESMYLASSSIGTLNPFTGPALSGSNWAQKRRTILSPNWRIVSVSITPAYLPSEVPVARAGLRFRVANGQGTYTGAMDQPNVVQLLTLRSTNGHTREYALHGFPDNSTTFDPTSGIENIGAGPELVAYGAYLISNPAFQLRVMKIGTVGVGATPISAISVAGGVVSFTALGLGVLAAGTKFTVAALKGYKVQQFAGQWRVAAYDTVTGLLTARSNRYIDSNFFLEFGSGTIRVYTDSLIGFEDIASVDVAGAHSGTHKVGNSAEGVRGRRSRRL